MTINFLVVRPTKDGKLIQSGNNMSVSVASNAIQDLGEGPFWDEATQSLYYVDIPSGDFCQLNSTTRETKKIHFDGTVSLMIPYTNDKHSLVATWNRKIIKLDWNNGNTEVLAEVENEGQRTRFNDGKCDAMGRLWAGTMGKGIPPAVEEGALYSFSDSEVKTQISNITISNGIAWSHDCGTMFYIDSYPKLVFAYDFDLLKGQISNQRVVFDYNKIPDLADAGLPDGMTMDQDGKLWIACFGGSRIIRVDPETAKILQTIRFPAPNITSCCFGGKNYDTLYVTSARYGTSQEEIELHPQAGSVFQVTGLNVKGSEENTFAG